MGDLPKAEILPTDYCANHACTLFEDKVNLTVLCINEQMKNHKSLDLIYLPLKTTLNLQTRGIKCLLQHEKTDEQGKKKELHIV